MQSSGRKLAGTLALLALVFVYVLIAMVVGTTILPGAGAVAQFIYYAVAGLAWVPAAAYVISWMHRT